MDHVVWNKSIWFDFNSDSDSDSDVKIADEIVPITKT